MDRETVKDLFGSVGKAAQFLDITTQAVYAWPEPFPQSIEDRINGALLRLQRDREDREGD